MVRNKDISWIHAHILARHKQAMGTEKSILGEVLGLFETAPDNWIPVTKRLPDKEFWEHQKQFEDEDLEVLVMIKGAKLPTMLLYNAEGEFYEMHGDGATFYIVTHWQPMPEPPKEDPYGE